jgi:hypothetical protein
MISGHRLPKVANIPFSVENSSAGNPCSCQSLTVMGSARTDSKEKSGLTGTLFSEQQCTHSLAIYLARKERVIQRKPTEGK